VDTSKGNSKTQKDARTLENNHERLDVSGVRCHSGKAVLTPPEKTLNQITTARGRKKKAPGRTAPWALSKKKGKIEESVVQGTQGEGGMDPPQQSVRKLGKVRGISGKEVLGSAKETLEKRGQH